MGRSLGSIPFSSRGAPAFGPGPDPGQPGAFLSNGAGAKAGLNTSFMDAGWVFPTILHAKAESAGREVIAVTPVKS
ncbi:hypothetical protein QFZ76_009651 [Streptomyces sp. V4I2]|nr:hypothetical protein [Streptomyces sp. V4I2]